jgi:phosphoserine phosphatase
MTEARRDTQRRQIGPEALTRILNVTRKLAAPFSLTSMLGEVVQAAQQVLEADGGTLWLYDRERHELVMRVATGIEPIRMPADRGIVGECVRTRAIINVPDCYADPRFNPEVDKRSGYLTRCMLTLPLIGHDEALVGVLQILNKHNGVFDAYDEEVAAALAAQCAVALQRVQMTDALLAGERLKQEIAVAREIQMSALPQAMPALAGYELFGSFHPADETGGDTFDLVALGDDKLFVLMGDATGHGVGPALSVTQMQAMLRLALRLGAGLDDAYKHVNNQLVEALPPERFVTAFLGMLDARAHALEFHSGGQGPILHFSAATGAIERLLPTSFPLGAFAIDAPRPPKRLGLAPGDIVALISDGIYEWPNAADEEFGIDRVEALLREHHRRPAADLAALIRTHAAAFAAGTSTPVAAPSQVDDVTIVLLKRMPEKPADPASQADSAEMELERSIDVLGSAFALIQQFWQRHGLPDAKRFGVEFAVEELFTNVVKYGSGGQSRILLRLERISDGVAVALVDPDSEHFDPTLDRGVDPGASLEARRPGGLGLHLIPKLVEDFAYEYSGRRSRTSFKMRTED